MSVVLLGSTSGSITLQEPAVAGTNTVNFGANTGVAILDANTPAFRNRIINGAMVIDQRNAGASITPTTSTYSVDRWNAQCNVASKYSIQQNAASITPPDGFTNYLGITSLSAYAVGAGEFFMLTQNIEGFNSADLAWGTSSAQTVTLSFIVRSSLTGTFGGAINNSDNSRSYPFTYTISAANTWEKKSVTIVGDTSGTWLKNNGIGVVVRFGLGMGSSISGTAGSWATDDYFSATGATSVVGTNGATFYITGVQLEKGSTATSFDYRSYGTELNLCYRYCYRLNFSTGRVGFGTWNGSTNADIGVPTPVEMRTTPSLTATTSGAILNFAIAWYAVTSAPSLAEASPKFISFTVTASGAGGTQGKGAAWGYGSISLPDAFVSAEL
jgi:hypothetical protein